MRLRPAVHLLLLAATTTGLVLGAAAPGSAGGADRKSYKTVATSTGALDAPRLGSLELVDYLSGEYSDRIIGGASRSEVVTLHVPATPDTAAVTATCKSPALRFYGTGNDWANDATPDPANLMLDCTYGGTKHRFWWGAVHNGDWTFDPAVPNCLEVTRTAGTTTTFTATASATCTAQDEILDSAYRTVGSRKGLVMPFRITFTVSGAVPAG